LKPEFNYNQKEAINHLNGAMMVVAGPGSGKTTVITHRIKTLIKKYGVSEDEILVITFTKVAAKEMEHRFNNLTSNEYKVKFATFHSFFFRIISMYYNYTVKNLLSKEEVDATLKNILNNLSMEEKEEDFLQKLINEIALVKNNLINPEDYKSNVIQNKDFSLIYRTYESIKLENNKIDFDDMMIKCHNLLISENKVRDYWQKKYKYILIDEFQDINQAQYQCIKMVVNQNNNLFIVGDDDQSVYKFRGSSPEFLLKFPQDYKNTKKIMLETNYRSTEQIINLSNRIISQNKTRYSKNIIGTNLQGPKPKIIYTKDVGDEAFKIAKKIKLLHENIAYENMAIIYRTNVQSSSFVDVFMDMNIPFQIKDEMPSIYEHHVSKDICAYLRLSIDRSLDEDVERIINKPKRYISRALIGTAKKQEGELLEQMYSISGIKKWQISKLEEFMFYLNAIKKREPSEAIKYIRKGVMYDSYIKEYSDYKKINPKNMVEILNELQETAKKYKNIEQYLNHVEAVKKEAKSRKKNIVKKGVVFTTMHSAKGLEYDTVFIVGANEDIIPHEKSKLEEEYEEELRLFYIAMTRAKNMLFISILKSRYEKDMEVTRFLKSIIK
jgi:DNA helicase II / ATP-dependent DNA helicase PcrA